jgi:hypothetical protein
MSSLQQNWRRQNRFCLEARALGGIGGGTDRKRITNNVYTYE